MSIILTCNAGSTNTKLAAFDTVSLERKGHATTHNRAQAIEWMCSIGTYSVSAVAHRVVHGGADLIQPTRITDATLLALKQLIALAPLHQPAAVHLIEEAMRLYPNVPHLACFDTAFHHTLPVLEQLLPLPHSYYEEGIRRYGFHGISYDYIASQLPQLLGQKANGRIIMAHLGGGSSACAMIDGQSIATTMGFSTLDGLMMSARCGSMDAGVVLHLLHEKNMSVSDVTHLLYQQSGLLGVSGISGDMQTLVNDGSASAAQAIELYCRSAAKQIAGLIPSLGGLDTLVFTGGIGEHASTVRAQICQQLAWLGLSIDASANEIHATTISTHGSLILVCVIPTNEEAQMAKYALPLVAL